MFVGTWIERKGIRELCEAWSGVCRRSPDAHLTVVGTATGDQVLRDFRAHCRDRVTVVPHVEPADLPELLSRQDLFVLPTWFEGMPLSMLEAAASGLACVVGATCGNLDFFPPDDPEACGGILIPLHDSAALASAIERFIDEPGLCGTLGERARARAREYPWRRTAENLLAAYDRAVGGADGQARKVGDPEGRVAWMEEP